MRPLFIAAAALCVIAAPAAAQTDSKAEAAARALNNPMVQEGVALMVDQVAGIVLDTRVGPLARYVDPEGDVHPNETLGDVQRRRDPHFQAKLHAGTRNAVRTAGAVANDAMAMGDELGRTAARLQAALAPLAAMLDTDN
jgi:hypothetical protein